MKEEVLSIAAKHKIFFSHDAVEMILSNSNPLEFTNTIFSHLSKSMIFVNKQDIINCITGDKIIFKSKSYMKPQNKFISDLSVIQGTDVTGNSTCEGKISDFTQYFKNRFFLLKKIIEKRSDFNKAMKLSYAMTLDRDVHVIGIIYEKNITKNGHVMITIEDETGTAKVFISKDSPLIKESFIDDEVIGVAGRPNTQHTFLTADRIFRPDIPKSHIWEPSDSTSKIAFLSDIHVGSLTFLENSWQRMIKWLKENSIKDDINYIVFPGDVVDGIGIFPDQYRELKINDIYRQYNALADYLKEIPDHIMMVVHPGNHDAVRLAEPQPALNSAFSKSFDSNIKMVGNPVYINVEGRIVLSYHGKSIDDWVSTEQRLTYDNPLPIMREMCRRRHLAPIYGQKNALAPEKKDYMVMEHVPDIFVSGHVHGAGQDIYNGIRIINASTWQSQTEYQRMHNFNPNPGIMSIVDLGTGEVTMQNFYKP